MKTRKDHVPGRTVRKESGAPRHTRLGKKVPCDDVQCVRNSGVTLYCQDPVVYSGTTTLVCGGGV